MTEWREFERLSEFDKHPLTTLMGVQLVRETEEYLEEATKPELPIHRKIANFIVEGLTKQSPILYPFNRFRRDI
jgi:hypothetical protein